MARVKVTVYVMPKPGLLDPQGKAVNAAINTLGLQARAVSVGKVITLEVDRPNDDDFQLDLGKVCRELLSNPVIEEYRYEIEE